MRLKTPSLMDKPTDNNKPNNFFCVGDTCYNMNDAVSTGCNVRGNRISCAFYFGPKNSGLFGDTPVTLRCSQSRGQVDDCTQRMLRYVVDIKANSPHNAKHEKVFVVENGKVRTRNRSDFESLS